MEAKRTAPAAQSLKVADIINGETYTIAINGEIKTAMLESIGNEVIITEQAEPRRIKAANFDSEVKISAHALGQDSFTLSHQMLGNISNALYFTSQTLDDIDAINQAIIDMLQSGKSSSCIIGLLKTIDNLITAAKDYNSMSLSCDISALMGQQS